MKKIFKNKSLLLTAVFVVSIVYSVFYSFFGIDMTDTCLHLYIQRNSFHGSGDVWMSVPLTNFIGGWWLSVSPIENTILWANWGGALLYTISMVAAVKIYLLMFDQITWKDWIAIVCIILLVQNKDTVSYYHFPVTLCNIFFYFLLRSVKNRDLLGNYFILGCLGGIILFSRFTFLTILFFSVAVLLYNFLFLHKEIKKQLLAYLVGISLSTILLLPLFFMWKSQFTTGSSELTAANIIYRVKSLFRVIMPLTKILPIACTFILTLGLIERYVSKRKQKKTGITILIFSFVFSFSVLIVYSLKRKEWWSYFGALPNEIVFLLIIPAILFIMLFIALCDSDLTGIGLIGEERFYIVLICVFSLIIPLGSDVAFCKLGYMAPIYLMILGGCILHRTIRIYPIRLCIFYAFLLGSVIIRPLYSYLDAPILKCNASPQFSKLKFLHTTKQRAQDWDQLLSTLEREVKNENEVLMVGYLNFGPLYLLNLRDWNHGVCTGGKNFMKRYYVYAKQKKIPTVAFVDENSDEFNSFKDILQDNYQSIYRLKRQHFCYSVWRKK